MPPSTTRRPPFSQDISASFAWTKSVERKRSDQFNESEGCCSPAGRRRRKARAKTRTPPRSPAAVAVVAAAVIFVVAPSGPYLLDRGASSSCWGPGWSLLPAALAQDMNVTGTGTPIVSEETEIPEVMITSVSSNGTDAPNATKMESLPPEITSVSVNRTDDPNETDAPNATETEILLPTTDTAEKEAQIGAANDGGGSGTTDDGGGNGIADNGVTEAINGDGNGDDGGGDTGDGGNGGSGAATGNVPCQFCPDGFSFQNKASCSKPIDFAESEDGCAAARDTLLSNKVEFPSLSGLCQYCVPNNPKAKAVQKLIKQKKICTLCKGGKLPKKKHNFAITDSLGGTCGEVHNRLIVMSKVGDDTCGPAQTRLTQACGCPKKKQNGTKKKKKKQNGGGGGDTNDDCLELTGDNIFSKEGRRELQKRKGNGKNKGQKKKKKGGKKANKECPTSVNFVIGLYTAGGLTAQDFMDGAAPAGDSSPEPSTYISSLENVLELMWLNKNDWSETLPDSGFSAITVSSKPKIVSAIDVECPLTIPAADPVTGAPITCHDFTVNIVVVASSESLTQQAVADHVLEAFDEGQKNGVLTELMEEVFVDGSIFLVTTAPPPPPPEIVTTEPTLQPTDVPTVSPTTASPTTMSPTKAPSIYVSGTMDVDVILGLYNSKGYTAMDLVNGITPEGSTFTFKGFLEAALGFVWGDKYPNSRRLLLGDGEEASNYPPYLQRFRFIDFKSLRGRAHGTMRDFDLDLDDRRLGELDLKLVNINITSGIDVDCPDYVPAGTVSGAVNNCQNVTATFTVQAVNLLRQDVRDDVVATFDEAQMDGTLSQRYNDIDARRIWRVQSAPRGAYSASDGSGDSGGNFTGSTGSGPPNASTKSSGDEGDSLPIGVIIGASVGGVVVLCCCLGGFVYWRRSRAGGKVDGEALEDEKRKTEAEEWNADENTGYDNGGYDNGGYDNENNTGYDTY